MVYSYKSLTEDQIHLKEIFFLNMFFYNIWISQYVNHVNFFMCEFQQRMKDNFISESPKCHLYRYIFDNNVLQFYLDHLVNYIYKPGILQIFSASDKYLPRLLRSLILCTDSNCTNLKHDNLSQ
jgi:hypothetical protein